MLEHLNYEDWPPLPFSRAALTEALKEYTVLAADPLSYVLLWQCEKCGTKGRLALTTSVDEKRHVLLAHYCKSGRKCLGIAHVKTWREDRA